MPGLRGAASDTERHGEASESLMHDNSILYTIFVNSPDYLDSAEAAFHNLTNDFHL